MGIYFDDSCLGYLCDHDMAWESDNRLLILMNRDIVDYFRSYESIMKYKVNFFIKLI